MEDSQEIKFRLEDNGVGLIFLNRPRALNALTLDMIRRMAATLQMWEEDAAVKMIILQGEGDRAFCSGGDVKSIAKAADKSFQTDFIREEYRLDHLISRLATPYVSVLDGVVMGGGVGVSRMGGVRVATERTVLAMPECAIGLVPDIGSGHILGQLPGRLGLFLGLTGEQLKTVFVAEARWSSSGYRVSGWECRQLGLATHYIPSSRLEAALAQLTSLAAPTLADIAQLLAGLETSGAGEPGAEYLSQHLEEINLTFGAASLQEVISNLEAGTSEFCRESLAKINKGSPTSLAITFKQLTQAPGSYKDALIIEYR